MKNIVWVAGGRTFYQREKMFEFLDQYHAEHPIDVIITGSAYGADMLAEEWAKTHAIMYVGVPAKWNEQGKAAGVLRNVRIAEMDLRLKVSTLIAFPGGKGTAHAVQVAQNHDIPVKGVADI